MQKAKEWDRRNPRFAHTDTGAEANHSSTTPSIENDLGEHAQSDEDLQNVPPPQDPNISGMTPTEDCYTWLAGSMDGWCENDDYRSYFERSIGCDGMLACDPADGDYDDNGGMPTGVGHHYGVHGPNVKSTEPRASEYPLGPVIIRRI